MALAARTTNGSATGDLTSQISNLTVTFGSAVASTDVVVAAIACNNGGTPAGQFTPPAGWTQILARVTTGNGTNITVGLQGWLAYGNVASKTFTVTTGAGSQDCGWVTQAFTGADQTTALDVAGATNSNSAANSISAATFNTVTDGALEIVLAVDWNAGHVFSATGFTAVNNGATHVQCGILYATSAVSPAGATGAKTINDSAAASGNFLCVMSAALRPASAAVNPTNRNPNTAVMAALCQKYESHDDVMLRKWYAEQPRFNGRAVDPILMKA